MKKLVDALVELLKIKSLITLGIITAMIYLAVNQIIEPATFMTLAGSIVTYYFTKQSNDTDKKNDDKLKL